MSHTFLRNGSFESNDVGNTSGKIVQTGRLLQEVWEGKSPSISIKFFQMIKNCDVNPFTYIQDTE